MSQLQTGYKTDLQSNFERLGYILEQMEFYMDANSKPSVKFLRLIYTLVPTASNAIIQKIAVGVSTYWTRKLKIFRIFLFK